MVKVDRVSVFFWAKIITLFVGVVLCVAFQFSGVAAVLLSGLAFFACAFLLIGADEAANLVVLHATVIEETSPEETEKKKKELYNKKLVSVVKMILAFGMAAFTVVILFLF